MGGQSERKERTQLLIRSPDFFSLYVDGPLQAATHSPPFCIPHYLIYTYTTSDENLNNLIYTSTYTTPLS